MGRKSGERPKRLRPMKNLYDRPGGTPTLYLSSRAANVLERAGIEIFEPLGTVKRGAFHHAPGASGQ